jgi:hypothetical protein
MAQQSYGTWAPRDTDALVQQAQQALSGGGGGGAATESGFNIGNPGASTWEQGGGLFGGGSMAPEDRAKYFDAYGGYKFDDPDQVAAESGISLAQLAGGFLPRQGRTGIGYEYASDRGGFFNAQDLFRKLGRDVPGIATHQMSGPSTNNWRLLGMGPGWIMRNGELINTQSSEGLRGGQIGSDMGVGISAEHGMSAQRGSILGTGGSGGTPNRWSDNYYWPGAAFGGYTDRWPTGTNV